MICTASSSSKIVDDDANSAGDVESVMGSMNDVNMFDGDSTNIDGTCDDDMEVQGDEDLSVITCKYYTFPRIL